jgi:hypothetical protein
MEPFFQATTVGRDPLYCDISKADNKYFLKARTLVETMWEECGQFLDPDLIDRATKDDFYTVWWELYLTYVLKRAGISLVPMKERVREKKGVPDLLARSPRTWIEAVMPTPGDGPDGLIEPPEGKAYSVPTDLIALRLCSAIQCKMDKFSHYLEHRVIQPGDATIIALSGARLPFRFTEQQVPSIVRALYGLGSLVLVLDLATRQRRDMSIEYRDRVLKQSNAEVPTNAFLRKESAHISAVIYSPSDCVNHPPQPGVEFVLVHNPNALVPIHESWLRGADQYWLEEDFTRVRWTRGEDVLQHG